MPAKLTTQQFIEKARAVHGMTYDYSQVVYNARRKKVIIRCSVHGPFEQTANGHLNGNGCDACGGTKTLDTPAFLARAIAIHGDVYDYSLAQYSSRQTLIKIICKVHGLFEQMPNNHFSGAGCPRCARLAVGRRNAHQTEVFVRKATEVHGSRYDYSLVNYQTTETKILIRCQLHGEFKQTPHAHLIGQGCRACGYESIGSPQHSNTAGAWQRKDWIRARKGRKSKLYVVRLYNAEESFYKVGITHRSVEARFTKRNMPYSIEIVTVYESEDAGMIYDKERQIKRQLRHLKYQPKIPFPGQHECIKSVSSISVALS